MILRRNLEEISTSKVFQRPQIAFTLWAHAILLVFMKIYSCLFIPNCTQNHVITNINGLGNIFSIL